MDWLGIGPDDQIGVARRLVGIGDAREVLDLSSERALVESFDVALDQRLETWIHEHLDERDALRPRELADFLARVFVRRDGRRDNEDTVLGQQPRDEAN